MTQEGKPDQGKASSYPEANSIKPTDDTPYIQPIIGKLGWDTREEYKGLFGLGASPNNGVDFHVFMSFDGINFDGNAIDNIWNNGAADKVKQEVDSATAEIPAAVSAANSAVQYADSAIAASKVNSDAINDINSAVSNAASAAAVARSDGLRAWNAAQSNVNLIDLNYASASAAISSTRTEAITAADEAKTSASAAQADIVAVKSDVAAVQADVTATRSDVAVAKSAIADTNTSLASQAKSLSSYAAQASANGADIVTLKSQAGQLEQDMADTKGDVSQLKVSASAASVALSDAANNISSLQVTAKSFSAALSDTNSNVASVTATASDLETKYADAANDISQIKTDAKGMTQTISDAQGDIAKLKTRADGFDTQFANINGDINKIQTDASGTTQTLTNAKSDIAVLQSRADGLDAKYADAAGDINTLKANASGFSQTLTNAQGDISTLKSTVSGVQTTLTDAQGNISTLQSDVSGLKKTTSDKAGNIATLQADAKTLTNQMSSAQGDISTLKQTASDFSSQVSGMEMSLADANSKITSNGGGVNLLTGSKTMHDGWVADGTSIFSADDYLVVSATDNNMRIYQNPSEDTNGKLMSVSFDADVPADSKNQSVQIWVGPFQAGVAVTISGNAFKRYKVESWKWNSLYKAFSIQFKNANDKINIKNIKLEFGAVATPWSPAPEDTDAKITANTTAIEQNKQAIALKADQTTVDKTNGTVQQLQSQLKVQADQIASKVSSSDLNAKGYATQDYTQSLVTQTAGTINESITSLDSKYNATVTQVQSLTASIDGLQSTVANKADKSQITQLSNVIQSKVSASDFNDLKGKTTWTENDSINFDDCKSQANIFTHSTNNAPNNSYWWYLQVTPGGDGRVTQSATSDRDSKHYTRQFDSTKWSAWTQDASESEITQLRDDINLRVKSGDLLSQINIQAGQTLIQSNKLYLDASSVVFSGSAFIPSAAIENLDASKLTFYGAGNTYATMGASVAQYDDDKVKSAINLQYNGGFEIHSSNDLGSILAMHDDAVRLAVKSQVYGSGSGLPVNRQYSGVWFGNNYTLMNTVDEEGNTSGISIGAGGGANNDYCVALYDSSKDNQTVWGTKVDSQRFDVYTGNANLFIGPDRAEMRGEDYATVHSDNNTYIEGKNSQIHLSDGNVLIDNPSNQSATGLHVTVQGWGTFSGYVEALGWTTKSTLSSKTRIQPLNTAKALATVNATDLTTFQYKSEVAEGMVKRHAGPVIDDVHDVAQYHTPDAFIAENRQGRSDADIVGYLMGAVQELSKQLNEVKEKI